MKNWLIKGVLIATYILIAMPLRIIFKVKRKGELEIKKSGKYIIASNHPSKLDPFIILASLPFRTYLKLIPTRFVTTQNYLTKWYHKFFLIPLGCISNKPQKNIKPLEILEKRLRSGETIFIFPRGELEKRGLKSEPKVGVVYLERNVKGSKIIPVKIKISGNLSFFNVIKRQVKFKVTFKKVFRHKEFKEDLQIMANEVISIIEKDGE
jgi:1-acyl-sn-glycerol-3-phosphate acyltransferase